MRFPGTWAIAYLALIPIFAAVYVNLGITNFAQSNLRNERTALEPERVGLADLLGRVVLAQTTDDWARFGPDLVAVTDRTGIGDLVIESDKVTFTFFGDLVRIDDEGRPSAYYPHAFSVQMTMSTAWNEDGTSATGGLPVHELEIHDPIKFDGGVPRAPTDASMRLRMESVGNLRLAGEATVGRETMSLDLEAEPTALIYVVLTPGEENDFQFRLRAYVYGDPLAVTDFRSRVGGMIYLSAVTVTTLGFGDITPTTPSARFWVGTEAVLGVLTAGMFLNAVARRRRAGT